MLDILIIVWKIFATVVLIIVTITLLGTAIIKFFEFWKGKEGDDYKR